MLRAKNNAQMKALSDNIAKAVAVPSQVTTVIDEIAETPSNKKRKVSNC